MTIRKALVIFLLAGAPGLLPAAEEDGNQLLKHCKAAIADPFISEHAVDGGLCLGYLWGFKDAMFIMDNIIKLTVDKTDKTIMPYCLPEGGITNGQAMRIVIKYLEDNPQLLHLNRAVLTMASLRKAFPCK